MVIFGVKQEILLTGLEFTSIGSVCLLLLSSSQICSQCFIVVRLDSDGTSTTLAVLSVVFTPLSSAQTFTSLFVAVLDSTQSAADKVSWLVPSLLLASCLLDLGLLAIGGFEVCSACSVIERYARGMISCCKWN